MTTSLFILRSLKAGLTIADLDFFTIGEVFDILYEEVLDYQQLEDSGDRDATQADFDSWL